MSIQSAKAFVEKMKSDQAFAAKINKLETFEEFQAIIRQAGYDFTKEELNQVSGKLPDRILESVSGGCQITDSITQTNVKILG